MKQFFDRWRRHPSSALALLCSGGPYERLHAIAGSPPELLRKLDVSTFILDEGRIDLEFAKIGGRIGAIPAHKGSRFAQTTARRLALKLARRYSNHLGLSERAIIEAWYFTLWSELCTLLPIRQVGRRIAHEAAEELVLVPLECEGSGYLGYWERNCIERLLLAAEIRRAGGAVAFVLDAPKLPYRVTHIVRPHSVWKQQLLQRTAVAAGTVALVPSGIRGLAQVLAQNDDMLRVQGEFICDAIGMFDTNGFHETLTPKLSPLPEVSLEFVRQPPDRNLPGAMRRYTCTLPHWFLDRWLLHVLGERTRLAANEARRIVAKHSIREVHVCDHMFFESGLVADAVRQSGGRVMLWPHSSNAVHIAVRRSALPHGVACITSAGAKQWKAKFPLVPVTVASELMLRPCREHKMLTVGQPLTVVLIAGAHSLNRMPIVDIDAHKESYRRFFSTIHAMAPAARLVCKAKAPWESMSWLRSLAPPGMELEETIDGPLVVDLPNMIFVTISFGSTALLEGLGRGIPCMIVRETPVEDYSAIDPTHIPVGSIELVTGEIQKCRSHEYLKLLATRQLAWYARQTSFSPDAS